MGSHPLNLLLRFLLEMFALLSVGIWGWKQNTGLTPYFLAATIPISLAIIWGVFAVPNDPSRSGKAPIRTPGIIRLFIEVAIFGFAVWALDQIGMLTLSMTFGTFVLVHYLLSFDRVQWLLSQK